MKYISVLPCSHLIDSRRLDLEITFEKLWQINLEVQRLRLVRETVDSVVDFGEMEALILPKSVHQTLLLECQHFLHLK